MRKRARPRPDRAQSLTPITVDCPECQHRTHADYSNFRTGINEKQTDADFTTEGVTFLASAGDSGIYGAGGDQVLANYPAASPNVVGVGGTSITIDAAGDYPGTGPNGEVGWGDGTNSGVDGGSGGGLSTVESEPSWQTGVVSSSLDPTGARALPDVAMDSGSIQPYDVFTSTLSGSSISAAAVGWLGDDGTSASSPIWAGLIAIADQGRVLEGGAPLTGYTQTLPALYSLPSADFHDILSGNNGDPAGPGYDLVTGLGTPVANLLVPDLAGYQLPSQLSVQMEPPSGVTADSPFGLTVQVRDRLGNVVTDDTGTVTVALGNNPGNATLGGTLTVPVVNGVATFTGLTVSQPGSGYTLSLTAGGISSPQATTPINVTSSPTPTPTPTPSPAPTDTPTPTATSPLMILGEQSLFRRQTNHRGKLAGKPVLTGFAFTFSAPLDPSSGTNPANYRVDTAATKRVKIKDPRILQPFTGFTVSYNAASDSVTLALVGKQAFLAGGQVTVVGGASGGVTATSGATLAESATFKEHPKGERPFCLDERWQCNALLPKTTWVDAQATRTGRGSRCDPRPVLV